MRIIVLYLLFIALTNSSFIGDIENVMSSLQSGFQKLILDVVTDVKETIDCTVVAVENALSLGVTNNATYRKCTGVPTPKASEYSSEKQSHIILNNKQKHEDSNPDIIKQITSNNRDLISQNKKDLNGLQAYLKDELEKISLSISEEVKKISDEQKSTEDSVAQYISYIHNIERTSDNRSEVEHLQNVLKGASKFVNDNYRNYGRNDENIQSVLTSLGQKSEVDQTSDKEKFSISKFEDKITSDISEHSQTYQNSFKDVSDKRLSTGIQDSKKENIVTSNHNSEGNTQSLNSIFGGNSQSGESYKDVLNQAKEFLKDSERTTSIVNNLFAKAEKSGKNIFDLS